MRKQRLRGGSILSTLKIIVLVFLSIIPISLNAFEVESVRLWRAPDSTRLVFDLSGPSEHKIFTLTAPNRLVIDVDNTQFKAKTDDLVFANTPISKMRYGLRDKTDLRVVLDLKTKVNPRSFFLKAHGDKPDRLVIDLFDKEEKTAPIPKRIVSTAPQKRDIIIAIDAGHGGEDPGALGPRRIKEKDVVLKIATQLKWLFEKESGYAVKMIRTGDYYISLSDRRNAARTIRADLFVSIHADAFENPKASGASVYALSRRGATSETARFLASRENEADLIGGVGDVTLDDKDQMLAGILVDLSMNATLANSLNVGDRVLKNLGAMTKLHSKRVEQAGFAVLKSPDVPSILVETGYISNPNEARKLNTPSYRKKIATAIFKGIQSYFEDAPPEGTLLSWNKYGEPKSRATNVAMLPSQSDKKNIKNNSAYVIVKGDTLSDIARRFDVSVAAILKANNLRDSSIRIGQKILIPSPNS